MAVMKNRTSLRQAQGKLTIERSTSKEEVDPRLRGDDKGKQE